MIDASLSVRKNPLLVPALAAGFAIYLAKFSLLPWPGVVIAAVLIFLFTWLFFRRKAWAWWGFVFVFFLGYATWDFRPSPSDSLSARGNFHEQTVKLRLRITEEVETSSEGKKGIKCKFPAQVLAIDGPDGWEKVHERIICYLTLSEEESLAYGDMIESPVYLRKPDSPQSPGAFHAAAFYWVRGWSFQGTIPQSQWVRVGEKHGNPLISSGIALRRQMRKILSLGLEDSPHSSALMAAMLFGERDGLSDQILHQFEVTGTLHLFAVSGQNIQQILIILLILLYFFGLIRWRWGWLTIFPLSIFIFATGLESSAVRAFLMASLGLIAFVVYRPVSVLNILSASALILWLYEPRQFFDLGFQFSFLVVLGLVLAVPPLYRWLYPYFQPDDYLPRKYVPGWRRRLDQLWVFTCAAFCTSAAAWVASLPLTLIHFHLFAPMTVLANLLVVPLASAVLILSLFSVVLGSMVTLLAVWINQLTSLILAVMVSVISLIAQWPQLYRYVSRQPAVEENMIRITIPQTQRSLTAWVESSETVSFVGPGSENDWHYVNSALRKEYGINRIGRLILSGPKANSLSSLKQVLSRCPVDLAIQGDWVSRSQYWKRWESERSAYQEVFVSKENTPWVREENQDGQGVKIAVGTVAQQGMQYRYDLGDTTLLFLNGGIPEQETFEPVDVLVIIESQSGINLVKALRTYQPRLIILPPPGL
ncbi:MAG: ComEC/Rec2 family competence protein [Verrucomicrobiota bacterium]